LFKLWARPRRFIFDETNLPAELPEKARLGAALVPLPAARPIGWLASNANGWELLTQDLGS
jgi:hypothetical protein